MALDDHDIRTALMYARGAYIMAQLEHETTPTVETTNEVQAAKERLDLVSRHL